MKGILCWFSRCVLKEGEWIDDGSTRTKEIRCVRCNRLFSESVSYYALAKYMDFIDRGMRKSSEELRLDHIKRLRREREDVLEDLEPWQRRLAQIDAELAKLDSEGSLA